VCAYAGLQIRISRYGVTTIGKSSLLQALFRYVDGLIRHILFHLTVSASITETRRGAITIDGVDIRSIALSDLRHRLSLVPQESVLFVSFDPSKVNVSF
jgi:ABC-type transport system involved in Fe-S cluster assembly fused permease/ATPase subunit